MEDREYNQDLELGYRFSPPCHPDHPRHKRLDITIHASPTLHHYDPEVTQFSVFSPTYGYQIIKIRHPWVGKVNYQVFVRCVILRDRKDKVVEAFTFGGDLHITSEIDCTLCSLQSTAPILPMSFGSSNSTLLADEVRILLAERREIWEQKHPRPHFEEQLARIEPFILNLACLEALFEKFSNFRSPKPEYV